MPFLRIPMLISLLLITPSWIKYQEILPHRSPIKSKAQIKKEFNQREINCLADNIYMEAATESEDGQIAVAQVTINRTHRKWYPKTVCGVVYENDQFSWTKTTRKPKRDSYIYSQIKKLASLVFTNRKKSSIIGTNVLYYHADYIEPPAWTANCVQVASIGTHVFYAREKDIEYNN